MDRESNYRKWDELMPDALGLIFKNLSLKEVLTVIPGVCKSWDKVVMGPYCWQVIDIEEWCIGKRPKYVDRMLQVLIPRSCGSLRKLCVSGVHNDAAVAFIAEHADCLETLRLPRSKMSDSIVEQIAGRLTKVTFLDVSYCSNISAAALGAIGKNCKSLTRLCRNMDPCDISLTVTQDKEAQVIANTMPKLRSLELTYNRINNESVMDIISGCGDLEFLDLRGCWDVNIDVELLKAKYPKLNFLGPSPGGDYKENLKKYYLEMSFWDRFDMLKRWRH